VTPTSYFIRISKGQDRQRMLNQLASLGTVHDDPDAVMVSLAYMKDLTAFQALLKEWEAEGRARFLDMGA
jgi:hypothetical protein